MEIKMAAIDLDGTLLRDDMSISDFPRILSGKRNAGGYASCWRRDECLMRRVPRRKNWDFPIHL